MSKTVALLERLTIGGENINNNQSISAGAEAGLSETVPDGSTDLAVNYTLDVSACVFFMIVSDQDVTVETNDSGSPDDTLSLTANVPYIWHENSVHSFLLTTDVTGLFVTNSSGQAATLQIESLYDPTP